MRKTPLSPPSSALHDVAYQRLREQRTVERRIEKHQVEPLGAAGQRLLFSAELQIAFVTSPRNGAGFRSGAHV